MRSVRADEYQEFAAARGASVPQGPGEKGGEGVVMWTVGVLRPDGIRVAVSAFNSGAQHTAATRGIPDLTMAQLKDSATSDEWAAIG
ncbi:hypothetical protein [Streptomyces sp. HM190]|uniref:hypothetical protein n=1 Tax=Streptomyces sp. HM190 TaxID=2695266 RepID=UPI003FA6DAC9